MKKTEFFWKLENKKMNFKMRKYLKLSFIMMSVIDLSSTVVIADDTEFDNLCAYGLTGGQTVKTSCVINETINKKTYCFGTQEAKTEFLKDSSNNIQKASENFLQIKAQLDDDLDNYTPLTGSVTKNNDGAEHQLQRRIDRNVVTPGGRDEKELEWEQRRDF
ncbi:MAG: hypothetical protein ACKOW3_02640 [Hyphomicrobium sp.]